MINPGFRGCRNALAGIIPRWLSNRTPKADGSPRNVGYTILFVVALLCDALIETALQGFRASMPGKGTPDALPLIGQTRGLIQGPFETADNFAARCLGWQTTWENCGASATLAKMIQAYLTYPDGVTLPTVTVIERRGVVGGAEPQFTTAFPDGSTVIAFDPAWDWDSQSNPTGDNWWSDCWIVVYPTPAQWVNYTASDGTDPNWTNAFDQNGFGLGHTVDRVSVDAITTIVRTWKGAHTYIKALIWTTDASLFLPGSLGSPGNPDGTWGYEHKYVGGVAVPSRTTKTAGGTVRYWYPEDFAQ